MIHKKNEGINEPAGFKVDLPLTTKIPLLGNSGMILGSTTVGQALNNDYLILVQSESLKESVDETVYKNLQSEIKGLWEEERYFAYVECIKPPSQRSNF